VHELKPLSKTPLKPDFQVSSTVHSLVTYYLSRVTVYAGAGVVWEILTLSIPMAKPTHPHRLILEDISVVVVDIIISIAPGNGSLVSSSQ